MACETQPFCLVHTVCVCVCVCVWANSDILETTKSSLLPVMKGGILSVPLALQPNRRVLPLCKSFHQCKLPFKFSILLGVSLKNRPVSSAL